MNIIYLSVISSFIICVAILIRFLAVNIMPKKVFIVVWCILALRLLIPFYFVVSNPVMAAPQNLYANSQTVLYTFTDVIRSLPVNEDNISSIQAATQSYDLIRIVLTVTWISGMIICATFFIFSHRHHLKEYKTALPVKCEYISNYVDRSKLKRTVRVLQTDKISAPLTYGIIKPVILFPKFTDWQDENRLGYILTHELIHIKRFDILFKWLLATVLCIHWFNPFVWIMFYLADRDIELSCDEAVINVNSVAEKSKYAQVLIGLEENRSGYFSLCSNFAKNIIEERVNAIMKIKKVSLTGIIIAVVFVTGIIAGAIAISITSKHNDDLKIDGPKIYMALKSLQDGPYTYTADTLTVYGDGNKMVMVNKSSKAFILDRTVYQFDDKNKLAYSYTVNNEWSFLDTLIDWVENGTLIDSGYADFMGTEVYFEEIRLISGEVYRFFFNGDDLLGEWNAQNNVYSTAFIAKGTPLDIFELPE